MTERTEGRVAEEAEIAVGDATNLGGLGAKGMTSLANTPRLVEGEPWLGCCRLSKYRSLREASGWLNQEMIMVEQNVRLICSCLHFSKATRRRHSQREGPPAKQRPWKLRLNLEVLSFKEDPRYLEKVSVGRTDSDYTALASTVVEELKTVN
jgi:hypothetical protein